MRTFAGSDGSRATTVAVTAALLVAACGGAGDAGTDDAPEPDAVAAIPVSEPTGPIDEDLAEEGERAFRDRGCVACHTVGKGRLVGPDLAGVTERRTFEWYYHMVTNPDSMTRNDSAARRLLAEYLTPMLDQGATPEEVRAMWEHLRHESAEMEEEAAEADDAGRTGEGG